MAQANSRSAGLRPREQFWLDHLRTARKQGQTLKAYAQAHGLSVSALYTAHNRQIANYGVDVRVEARPPYPLRFRTAP